MKHLKDLEAKVLIDKAQLKFLPHTKLRAHITKETVEAIFPHHEGLATFIVDDARAVFATLVMMGKPCLIKQFFDNKLGQGVLPVSCVFDRGSYCFRVKSTKNGDYADKVHKTFSQPPWESYEIETFCLNQWIYTSPIFKRDKFRYEFELGVILPYTLCDEVPATPTESKNGGYGVVDQKSIHADHIELLPGQVPSLDSQGNHRVAIKTLNRGSDAGKIAEKEAKALELMRQKVKSSHAIQAIAYFQKKREDGFRADHCFVLPWAERGNLWDFWADGRTSPGTEWRFLVWVFRQLSGLTEAVAEMHGLEGENLRHGDLKPENVLCFRDDSQSAITPIRLVLTDVGLAKAHEKATDQRKQQRDITSTSVSTVRYQAPELETQSNETRILSQDFDVWSLGCIYMEFVIWLLYGLDGLVRFTAETEQFWQPTGEEGLRGAKVHERVDVWLSHMANWDSNRPTDIALERLVGLIKRNLLVVGVESLERGEDQSAPPAAPKPSKSSIGGRIMRHFSGKKAGGGGGIPGKATIVPGSTAPYRSSSKEAATRLREITSALSAVEIESSGEGAGREKERRPPPPQPTSGGAMATKKKRWRPIR